jgi:hypothetical protein
MSEEHPKPIETPDEPSQSTASQPEDGASVPVTDSPSEPVASKEAEAETLPASIADNPPENTASDEAKAEAELPSTPIANSSPESVASDQPEADSSLETIATDEPEAENLPATGVLDEPEADSSPESVASDKPEVEPSPLIDENLPEASEPPIPSEDKAADTAEVPAPVAATAPKPIQPTSTQASGLQRRAEQVQAVWRVTRPVLVKLWQIILFLLNLIWKGWLTLLPLIRRILPPAWAELPNSVLTAIALVLLVGGIWLTSALTPDRPTQTATAPPAEQPTVTAPAPARTLGPRKMAALQEQLMDITAPYGEDLIRSLQFNLERSRIELTLSPAWYTLSAEAQNNLANDLLKRTTKLKFQTLEVLDENETLLARSPVVGKTMVIFQRSLPDSA